MVMAPVWVLLPERVKTPLPLFTRPPVPEIRPEKVESLEELLVRVPAPIVILPEPVSDPKDSL